MIKNIILNNYLKTRCCQILITWGWIGLFCLNVSCSEEIDWDVRDSGPRLTVDGAVTNEEKIHSVQLSMSQGLFEEKANTGISHAMVRVHDGEQTFIFEEDPENSGHYLSADPFAGEVGKNYRLEIELPEAIDGITTLQASATMAHQLVLDSVTVINEVFVGEEAYTIRIFGPKPTQPFNYYLIHVFRNGEKLTKDLVDLILLDNADIEGFHVNNIPIYRSEDIREGDVITLEVHSLTKAYFTFLTHTISSIQGNDMMGISGPPANAIGNLGAEVMGYFHAAPIFRISRVAE